MEGEASREASRVLRVCGMVYESGNGVEMHDGYGGKRRAGTVGELVKELMGELARMKGGGYGILYVRNLVDVADRLDWQ